MTSENTRVDLLTLQELRSIGILLLSETRLNPLFDVNFCSLFREILFGDEKSLQSRYSWWCYCSLSPNSTRNLSAKIIDIVMILLSLLLYKVLIIRWLCSSFSTHLLPLVLTGYFSTFSVVVLRLLLGKLTVSTNLTSSTCPQSCWVTSILPTQIVHLCIALPTVNMKSWNISNFLNHYLPSLLGKRTAKEVFLTKL